MIELVLLLLAAKAAPVATVCYASEPSPGEQIIVIAKQEKATLTARGLKRVACPSEMVWTAAAARDQCAFYAHYDAVQKFYFEDLHGVSTDDVCNEGRLAAGLKVKAAPKAK